MAIGTPPTDFEPKTLRYFRKTYHPNDSSFSFIRWAITLPLRSRLGAAAVAKYAVADPPTAWKSDFTNKRTLIVGSGPSLDRVESKFFDDFHVIVFINFAISKADGRNGEYFFTTDSGPMREYIDLHGPEVFCKLGKDRCIFAPIFLDQWQGFTDQGRALLTWLAPDKAGWQLELKKRFGLNLPFALRYYPRQPDWKRFELPLQGYRLPAVRYTSALSAILFAAMNGSTDIGLIGCDFSSGRATSALSNQPDPGKIFAGAATEFEAMKAALAEHGLSVTNYSWQV